MKSRIRSAAGDGFRPDIEGLRALAIGTVLLCHAGVSFFAGGFVGVDVFFVISGFLITRLLLAELERTGTISLRRFYARRAKRLLPLTAVVLGSVAIVSMLVLSPVRAVEVSGDIISSAIYTANWHFAAQSVDYFAQDVEPSPVLHLWSLAIEEQFYLVWPTLMLGVAWIAGWRAAKAALWVTVIAVFAGSLLLGMYLTDAQPAAAYFSTFGRAWELGLGAALALLGNVRIRSWLAAPIGWAGLAAVLYAALAFDSSTPFPGTAALIPTLGVAALILAGSGGEGARWYAPSGLLSLPPVRHVGRISYSWYLWHWPALIFAAAVWGPLSVAAGLAVVAASWVPAYASHVLVEDPVRLSRVLSLRPNRALVVGAACMAIGVGAGIALTGVQPQLRTAPAASVEGAAALADQPSPQRSAKALRPNPLRARDDRSRAFYDGCLVGIEGTTSEQCLYGDPNGKRTVVLFGDSHAMQYFPAIEALAKSRHWRLIALTKAECTPGEVQIRSMVADREYSQCDTWREAVLRRIETRTPKRATVLMSGDTVYTPYGSDGEELLGKAGSAALEQGYVDTLERLHESGRQVVVIKDLPASTSDVPSCVSKDMDHLDSCAFERVHDRLREFDVRAAESAPGALLIDLTPEVCPSNLCRAVIGNALVYRDKSHLTATFARTLESGLGRELDRVGIS